MMIDKPIEDLLRSLGLTASYQGYYSIVYAVQFLQSEPDRLELITKCLYPDVAKITGQDAASVDSSIRTAIRQCSKRNPDGMTVLFGTPEPTVQRFLTVLTQVSQEQDGSER